MYCPAAEDTEMAEAMVCWNNRYNKATYNLMDRLGSTMYRNLAIQSLANFVRNLIFQITPKACL